MFPRGESPASRFPLDCAKAALEMGRQTELRGKVVEDPKHERTHHQEVNEEIRS